MISKRRTKTIGIALPIVFIFLLSPTASFAQDESENGYLWPVKAPKKVTSVLGDIRRGHPHAGIDISLFGKVGTVPIVSVDHGRLLRIRVSPYGYGKAMYIQMDDANTAVYAHLDRFSPRFEKLVQKIRRTTGRWKVDEVFLEGGPEIERGELIAYGGDTGTSSAHLHFEIRNKDNICLNPLTLDIPFTDAVAPRIRAVLVSPLHPGGRVNGSSSQRTFSLVRQNGVLTVAAPIRVSGRVGLSVLADDAHQPKGRRYFPYQMTLFNGEEKLFEYKAQTCSYADQKVHLTQYDKIKNGPRPGDYLRLFNPYPSDNPFFPEKGYGFLDDLSNGTHPLTLVVADAHGNETRAMLTVVVENSPGYENPTGPAVPAPLLSHTLWIDKPFEIPEANVVMSAMEDGLFAPMPFEYSTAPPQGSKGTEAVGPCVLIQNAGPPIRKPVRFTFKYDENEPYPEKLGVFVSQGAGYKFIGNELDKQNRTVTGATDEMGTIRLARDVKAPSIYGVRPSDGSSIGRNPTVRLKAADAGSGLQSKNVKAKIDGKTIVLRYKGGTHTGSPHWSLSPGQHALTVIAVDNIGNKAEKTFVFTVAQ